MHACLCNPVVAGVHAAEIPVLNGFLHALGLMWGFPKILKGSWDLVTGVRIKVTILINTYNPT